MKKTEVKDATYYQNKILKMFQDKAGKFSSAEIFDDWLEWSISCIRLYHYGEIEHFISIRDYLSDKYDDTVSELFDNITNTLREGLLATESDILGVVFMRMHPKKNLGQFFTPQHICDFMTKLSVQSPEEIRKQIEENGGIAWSDPTCGAGAMLISVFKYAKKNGINTNKILLHGKDIDKRCAHMAFLQLELLGANGVVETGDTLLDTTSEVLVTTTQFVGRYGQEVLMENIICYQMMLANM